MRILHTSDWHLGHTLHGLPREREHQRFLQWLLEVLARERPDALLITGDVFETQNPPARAERAWFDFLAQARRARPGLSVLAIAGNHDAPARLEAPAPLLRSLDVRVVGTAREPGSAFDPERLLVPLRRVGRPEVAAWVAAVPFLRPSDLPPAPAGVDPERAEAEQVRAVYARVLELARARRQPGQALLATGHLPLGGALHSEGSERAVPIGRVRELPLDLFPEDLDYVALGHLHLAQAVGGREAVRYAGSPIPLSLSERDYVHQVVIVDLPGGEASGPAAIRTLPVPRSVELLRLPDGEPGAVEEVLATLRALPAAGPASGGDAAGPAGGGFAAGAPDACQDWPWLEVRVRLRTPDPALRRRVEEALEGRAARLVKLSVLREETPREGEAPAAASGDLRELAPLDVLRRLWEREQAEALPAGLEAAYLELVQEARAEAAREEAVATPPPPALEAQALEAPALEAPALEGPAPQAEPSPLPTPRADLFGVSRP